MNSPKIPLSRAIALACGISLLTLAATPFFTVPVEPTAKSIKIDSLGYPVDTADRDTNKIDKVVYHVDDFHLGEYFLFVDGMLVNHPGFEMHELEELLYQKEEITVRVDANYHCTLVRGDNFNF